jgi:hypothetical protein
VNVGLSDNNLERGNKDDLEISTVSSTRETGVNFHL